MGMDQSSNLGNKTLRNHHQCFTLSGEHGLNLRSLFFFRLVFVVLQDGLNARFIPTFWELVFFHGNLAIFASGAAMPQVLYLLDHMR